MKYIIEYDITTDEIGIRNIKFNETLDNNVIEVAGCLLTGVESETVCSAFLIGYARISKYWAPKRILQ